jgi:hypothetical protein
MDIGNLLCRAAMVALGVVAAVAAGGVGAAMAAAETPPSAAPAPVSLKDE